MDQYIMVCLNETCKQKSRFIKGLSLANHSSDCHAKVFGITALLQAQQSKIKNWPISQIGKLIKSHLYYQRTQNTTYFCYLKQKYKGQIMHALDQMFNEYQKAYPSLQLKYEQTYSLQMIKDIIKDCKIDSNKGSQIIKELLFAQKNNQKILTEIFFRTAQIYQKLEHIKQQIVNINQLIIPIKQTTQIQRLKHKLSPLEFVSKKYTLQKSSYANSKNILIEGSIFTFPSTNKGHFNPWLYGELSFTSGKHSLKLRHLNIQGNSFNCGIGIIGENDKNSFPFKIFKSFFDVSSSQLELVSGCQLSQIMEQGIVINGALDMDEGRFQIFDDKRHSVYAFTGNRQGLIKNRYRFCIVGLDWKVQLIHIS